MTAISEDTLRTLAEFDTGGTPVTTCYLDVDGRRLLSQKDIDQELDLVLRPARARANGTRSVHDDLDRAVERAHRGSCRARLGRPDVGLGVDHLALEVRGVDLVVVDHADRADARGSEVLEHGRPEATCADHARACVAQPALPELSDLGQQHVPREPLELESGERRTGLDDRRDAHKGHEATLGLRATVRHTPRAGARGGTRVMNRARLRTA